jgi:hypothetical protein
MIGDAAPSPRTDDDTPWKDAEVQGEPESAFAERMLVYNHRIRDAYAVPVASLAVLADGDARFRPER